MALKNPNGNFRDTLSQKLNQPFPENIIKTQPSKYDSSTLRYVEPHYYIQRLNEIFENQWSWNIINYNILETSVVAHCRLTITIEDKQHTFDAIGSAARKAESPGDDLKKATSDALKRACSMLGLGLHLYMH